jgi:nitrate/TMAO reductase-like tetraheme cytochrome c subunit
MGKEKGSARRATWLGVFVVGLMLALAVPSIALAANTATFSGAAPKSGSSSTATMPKISVTVYDKYGVKVSTHYAATFTTVDGGKVATKLAYVKGFGTKKFVLSYQVSKALSAGRHTVAVRIKDLKGRTSNYSWSFTVTSSDSLAPVTTSDAVLDYGTQAVITLHATDAGSGVDHTYFTLDGFKGEGIFVVTNVVGPHVLTFWSVDKAGNVEMAKTANFTVEADMITVTWHKQTTAFCTQSKCHFASLTVEHYQHTDANGVRLSCATCHNSAAADVKAAIAAGSDACQDCHGDISHPFLTTQHALVTPPTAVLDCVQAGCHGGATANLASIHWAASGTVGGVKVFSCGVCHANPLHAATNDCTVCHGTSGPHASNHVAIAASVGAWAHNLGDPSCTVCHGSNLMTPHTTTLNPTACGTCHNPVAGSKFATATVAAVKAGGATCTTCHGVDHVALAGTNHTIASSCDCHGDGTPENDLSAIHASQETTVNGVKLTSCAICHANPAHPVPTAECTACHANIGAIHASNPATVAVTGNPLGVTFKMFNHVDPSGTGTPGTSSACVACHGSELPFVHIGAPACICHTASFLKAEMAPLLAAGTAECIDCHKGTHAGHGFVSGSASGHNTTAYPGIGAKTLFDGSQGVTLKWKAVESTTLSGFADGRNGTYVVGQVGTMTTTWSTPTVNVFWKSGDAAAPATAITGLDWNSVITCQDCHTGLNAAGPHGAAQNWAIDPAYPGDYAYAELTKYVTANLAYASGTTVLDSARYNVPLSTSGIAMFPGAATHADVTSSSVAATASVPGWVTGVSALGNRTDGTKGATAVICAKCHDLENFNALSNVVEGSNTAHDSHHQDQLDGSAQCVNCHIGVPHGWKMPRLLVDTDVDVAPYLSPQALGTTRNSSTGSNTGDTRKLTAGWGQGFNGQGMQALSGVNNHTLGGVGGTQPYGTGDGLATSTVNVGHVGMAYWAEPQCEACGDHPGETPAQIINLP